MRFTSRRLWQLARSIRSMNCPAGFFLTLETVLLSFGPFPESPKFLPHTVSWSRISMGMEGRIFSWRRISSNRKSKQVATTEVSVFSFGAKKTGNFEPAPARESGLVISGDAMAATSCDLNEDGWPDLVVSRNSSRCLAFENAMITGRNSFSVSLRGGLGNPRAIGAKITVELKDGRRRSAEIYAGGGYLSQSVPEVFFGYPDGNEPKTITVRWPDGRATTHRWTGHRARIVIETDRSVVSSR